MPKDKKVAIVTGANRGIGFAICSALAKHDDIQVILTARSQSNGTSAQQQLAEEGLKVDFLPVDVDRDDSVEQFKEQVSQTYGRCDILINNAGIFPDSKSADDAYHGGVSVFKTKLDTVQRALNTNTFGVLRMCNAFIPMMQKRGYGRVVNISSGMGQLTYMNGGYPAYRLSKVALNALTRIYADETGDSDLLINSVCPGWVHTDMGGKSAPRSLEKGAETPVWLALLPKGGPNGKFFRDQKEIPW